MYLLHAMCIYISNTFLNSWILSVLYAEIKNIGNILEKLAFKTNYRLPAHAFPRDPIRLSYPNSKTWPVNLISFLFILTKYSQLFDILAFIEEYLIQIRVPTYPTLMNMRLRRLKWYLPAVRLEAAWWKLMTFGENEACYGKVFQIDTQILCFGKY